MRCLKLLLLAQCTWFFVACGSGGGGNETPVLPPAPTKPSISTPPAAISVVVGGTATLSVTATGTAPFSYQWFRAGVAIAGANAATFSLTPNLVDDGALFTVSVANLGGSVTSDPPARLTVTAAPVAPSFVRAPGTVSVVAGDPATFNVTMGGSSPFTYQWFRGGVAIAGAQSSSYTLTTALGDNDAQFSVRVSNAAGEVTSGAVALRVAAQFLPVSIIEEPQDVVAHVGDQVGFVARLDGTGPFTWRWLRGTDGTQPVETPTGESNSYLMNHLYVLTPVTLADTGTLISLRVTDSRGRTVTTRQARLTVLP